ncbi:antibiotic biosynthesis monooxygenase family protein [Desulfofustis glycolicus]|uniref:Quinol monooxygenase YgiN n=1 Tax=Desulfofustis glycolicus DSM 9705 TaxID=1121409 RepID=A0A1M5VFL1_9BACT|nr:antibiotic biosynthesis monooxygenase [Desulfofustis glycolicus]MCB2217550.1 antibiotic biosynthesis monooxygenase [Desulfobulbaceae bacterium]SHH74037.1 Quinol monooxygenase YgiN [Desulfofustis glycolicus DSM 9705]
MTVKIFIKRNVTDSKIAELTVLLKRLRSVTLMQPGYISGQTLKRVDRPGECLVISTWRSAEDWQEWLSNNKRIAIQNEIDDLLDTPTEYAVYE